MTKAANFRFPAEVWRYRGEAAWHFLTVPVDVSEEIRGLTAHRRAGFGSVRVTAEIGSTRWQTSIFPDKESGCFLLPLKADVRKREDLDDGTPVACSITLADATT